MHTYFVFGIEVQEKISFKEFPLFFIFVFGVFLVCFLNYGDHLAQRRRAVRLITGADIMRNDCVKIRSVFKALRRCF